LDISTDSVVVGRSSVGGTSHAFRIKAHADSLIIDLTPGAFSSRAHAINDSGQIAGQAQVTSSAPLRAVRWDESGTMEVLDNLPGGVEGQAFSINNNGVAVGSADLPFNGDIAAHAVMWDAAGFATDLGTLGGLTSAAGDINDSNVVVGSSDDAAGNFRAFVWSAGAGMQPLPTPFGGSSFANAINNAGEIVGGMTVGPGQTHAVLWRPNGEVVVLGSLGGSFAQAHDIDALGRVVGESRDALNSTRAFVWTEEDGMEDLGPPVGVATAISATGLVAGYAPPTGFSLATIWVLPSDETTIEVNLSRKAFEPVLARCFDAVNQVAKDLSARGNCESPATTEAVRTDTTTGTIKLSSNGSPLQAADVVVRVEPVDGSGFHLHDDGSRPPGRFLTTAGPETELSLQTDSDGEATFVYRSSGVAGSERLIVEYGSSADTIADTAAVDVALSLPLMPRSGPLASDSSGVAEYTFVVDAVGRHGSNTDNGATSEAQSIVLAIFNRYVAEFGASGFQDDGKATTPNNGIGFVITEASLPQGGLFDVGPELANPIPPWRNPHQFHRAGWDFDVRITNIPSTQRDAFETVCDEFGAVCASEGDHYHIYVDHDRRQSEGFKNG
jgi:probable HAF family extracellular repeat protein